MNYCSNCGEKLGEAAKYCPQCGLHLQNLVQETTKIAPKFQKDDCVHNAESIVYKGSDGLFCSDCKYYIDPDTWEAKEVQDLTESSDEIDDNYESGWKSYSFTKKMIIGTLAVILCLFTYAVVNNVMNSNNGSQTVMDNSNLVNCYGSTPLQDGELCTSNGVTHKYVCVQISNNLYPTYSTDPFTRYCSIDGR